MASNVHFAQVNTATARGDMAEPIMQSFVERLETLWRDGPTQRAFSFRHRFPPDGER